MAAIRDAATGSSEALCILLPVEISVCVVDSALANRACWAISRWIAVERAGIMALVLN
jgi:hypothetical protein